MNRRACVVGAAAMAGLVVLIGLAFMIGRFPIAPGELVSLVWARLSGQPHDLPRAMETVVFGIRGPRVVAAMLLGAALAAAGMSYQTLFRNPLVAPDILGVSAGAALGAALGIFFGLDLWSIQALAFAMGLASVVVVTLLARGVRGHDPALVLILSGVVIGALLGSALALIKVLADPYNQLPAITFWLLGSLAAINRDDVLWTIAPVVVGLAPLWLLRWRINVLALGDEEARALGVEVGRVRVVVILAATLMSAAVVSIAGIVGWVGLIVPHMARLLVGPGFARALPVATLMGAGYMLAIDTVARSIANIEVPLGVLTAVIGAPIFIWLLATTRRGWQ